MLKLSGKRPADLGVRDGKFTAARSWKPNWVSSQVDAADAHYIAPIKAAGDAAAAIQRVAQAVGAFPRTRIVEQKGPYLYAEFSTKLMGFTDDVEFYADGKALQVRSSSRLGVRDFDANRRRVEALRAQLEK
ncbi:MAG: DUF1499 domain-containing protein [Gammaproteobacteria bacterium]